ncbi:MAG: dephospho-CoA kinase [Acholeplasmatales bacterium]|nr:dephospho-CoA kinase [Acholeplasmatales bacterium]
MKKVIGITGGIASGKSNVCQVIKKLGYPIISCDEITRNNYNIGGKIYNVVRERFGDEFLLDDGNIDRKKLAKLIFSKESAKLLIDSITHPIIKEELLSEIAKYDDGLVFVEIPLLYEAKFDTLCDLVICVFLSQKYQVERLMEREGIDEDYALKKIHSQMDLYLKKSLADYVIDSKGNFDETEKQVIEVINNIKRSENI